MYNKEYPIFRAHQTSLKELSIDSSSDPVQYMTESSKLAINFDAVKTEYVNALGLSEEAASSVDALVHTSGGTAFIEFKNGSMKNEKRKVKDKIRDSLLIFSDITGKRISEIRRTMDFILVYNPEKNPLPNQLTKENTQESASRIAIAKYFLQKAGQELILFDLERFKRLYFRDVHTYTHEELKNYLERC